ncbi:hypothetical protein CLV92_1333 [Kineococcus xinjiangensis]|uniref:Uncharacterized protein n=1 Tax=Kineococcus xinjiangensis TaxID=512762 RepID=A0A2S6IBZ2_9ACTN|nr:hypothetical protein [Kineococcus xinjiangensis]PPK89803.1 hypothetical protein CLV92_1333 [Kineococcus xinjiangensis]
MDVVVEVGDWEHVCCGSPIERNEVVDLSCIRWMDEDGQVHLGESHHELDVQPIERVQGRVIDIHVVDQGGRTLPILRVPSGDALRGVDPADDGHLEDPWTGEVLTSDHGDFLTGGSFLVTIRTVEQPSHDPR